MTATIHDVSGNDPIAIHVSAEGEIVGGVVFVPFFWMRTTKAPACEALGDEVGRALGGARAAP